MACRDTGANYEAIARQAGAGQDADMLSDMQCNPCWAWIRNTAALDHLEIFWPPYPHYLLPTRPGRDRFIWPG